MADPSRCSVSAVAPSRRQLLTAVASGSALFLAGCSGSLGGDPRSLDPPEVVEDSPTSRVWNFPRGASDENTPVQTSLDQASPVPTGAQSTAVRFQFGASVYGHSDYRHDNFTVRLGAPTEGNAPPAGILVEPPEGFQDVRVSRDGQQTVVEVGGLETTGTIHFDFLVDPGTAPTPDRLAYDFTVRAANEGTFARDAVASAQGQFPVARE